MSTKMSNERKFYKCSRCGNIIGYLKKTEADVMCCGEKMQEMEPNTADAAVEKHVPVAKREGGILTVTVGSVSHPMTDEHHIAWIIAADGDRTQRVALASYQPPTAEFFVSDSLVTVYAYCNLHGLWEAQV